MVSIDRLKVKSIVQHINENNKMSLNVFLLNEIRFNKII